MVENPRWEDYNLVYQNKHNMFAFMGLGFTRNQVEEKDLSPYITKEGLEKKFYSFVPGPEEDQKVLDRKHKVNDGPQHYKKEVNGTSNTNGQTT